MVFTWIVLLTVLFGDGYFVGLRLLSAYPGQYFRVSPDAPIGHALARLTARQYLTAVIAGYEKLLRDVDISRFKKDEEVTWTIESGVAYEFVGPSPELDPSRLDPIKLDKFVQRLALSQEQLHRYYESFAPETMTYSDDVLLPLVMHWVGDNTVRKVGDNRVEVGMLLAAEKLLAHLCPGCDFSDGRELYVSALIFSGMLFMTARYGDIVPNSNVTLLVMIVQFVVYFLAFVLIFPFVLKT
jgi:hypothetical protein